MTYTGRQLHNDAKDLEAIADGYLQKLEWAGDNWLVYALQKDAVQNSWDAKISKDWGVKFSLLSTPKGRFLAITDYGTSGLTGHLWESSDEHYKLLDTEDPNENLAFFLSSNFSAKGNSSGGKRGRGKSLFLKASKSNAFYFESLRNDGIRVFGSQWIANDKSIQISLNQDKEFLSDEIGSDRPSLDSVGTSIFIKDPVQSIVDSLDNGALLNFVESTWWEIIKKYGASISFEGKYKNSEAGLLKWYDDSVIDADKSLRTKEYPSISLDHPGSPKIKRIKFIYDPEGAIPEGIKGIAIQRNGMTIQRKNTESLVKEEGMQKVYGWVEFEPSLEQLMYDLEDVEHLKFNWVANPAKKVHNAIQAKAREFAKEVKIIETDLSKQHDKYKKIEEDAAKKINDYLKQLGFTGFSVGTRPPRPSVHPDTQLPLSISLSGFALPNSSRRVDFDQIIKAKASAINNLDSSLDIEFRVWIVSNDDSIMLEEQEIRLAPGETFELGWDKIVIEKSKFKRGDYSFRAKIIVMEDTQIEWKRIGLLEKGNDRIRASAAFSVDQDPKASGFMKFVPKEELEDKYSYMEAFRDDNTVIIEYNTVHPYIAQVTSQGEEKLHRFLLENGIGLALNEILAEDLSSDKPKVFKNIDTSELDPTTIMPIIMQRVSEFLWIQ